MVSNLVSQSSCHHDLVCKNYFPSADHVVPELSLKGGQRALEISQIDDIVCEGTKTKDFAFVVPNVSVKGESAFVSDYQTDAMQKLTYFDAYSSDCVEAHDFSDNNVIHSEHIDTSTSLQINHAIVPFNLETTQVDW